MARRNRGKRHARRGFTLPLAVVAGFVPFVRGVWQYRGSMTDMSSFVSQALTGYDPGSKSFTSTYLGQGIIPIAVGAGVHMIASRFGINRLLGRARIPFVRI